MPSQRRLRPIPSNRMFNPGRILVILLFQVGLSAYAAPSYAQRGLSQLYQNDSSRIQQQLQIPTKPAKGLVLCLPPREAAPHLNANVEETPSPSVESHDIRFKPVLRFEEIYTHVLGNDWDHLCDQPESDALN